MNQIKIILISIAAILFLSACPEKIEHEFVYLNNNSDKRISFYITVNKNDSIFYCSNTGKTIYFDVESNSTYNIITGDSYSGWDNNLKLLTILIFDGELYDKYWQQPCDTIRKYVPVLHTYRLTLADLQQMNWTVVYPPNN
jgi:hypothetical protein